MFAFSRVDEKQGRQNEENRQQKATVEQKIYRPTAAHGQPLCHHLDRVMVESMRDELKPETNRSSAGRSSQKPVSAVATTTIVQAITQESTICQSMRGGDADAKARDGMSDMCYRRSHSRCGRNRRGSHRSGSHWSNARCGRNGRGNHSRCGRGSLRQRATTQVCHNPMRHALLHTLRGCAGREQGQTYRQRQNCRDTSNPQFHTVHLSSKNDDA